MVAWTINFFSFYKTRAEKSRNHHFSRHFQNGALETTSYIVQHCSDIYSLGLVYKNLNLFVSVPLNVINYQFLNMADSMQYIHFVTKLIYVFVSRSVLLILNGIKSNDTQSASSQRLMSCPVGRVVSARAYGSANWGSIPRADRTHIVFRKSLKKAVLEHDAR